MDKQNDQRDYFVVCSAAGIFYHAADAERNDILHPNGRIKTWCGKTFRRGNEVRKPGVPENITCDGCKRMSALRR